MHKFSFGQGLIVTSVSPYRVTICITIHSKLVHSATVTVQYHTCILHHLIISPTFNLWFHSSVSKFISHHGLLLQVKMRRVNRLHGQGQVREWKSDQKRLERRRLVARGQFEFRTRLLSPQTWPDNRRNTRGLVSPTACPSSRPTVLQVVNSRRRM